MRIPSKDIYSKNGFNLRNEQYTLENLDVHIEQRRKKGCSYAWLVLSRKGGFPLPIHTMPSRMPRNDVSHGSTALASWLVRWQERRVRTRTRRKRLSDGCFASFLTGLDGTLVLPCDAITYWRNSCVRWWCNLTNRGCSALPDSSRRFGSPGERPCPSVLHLLTNEPSFPKPPTRFLTRSGVRFETKLIRTSFLTVYFHLDWRSSPFEKGSMSGQSDPTCFGVHIRLEPSTTTTWIARRVRRHVPCSACW